MTFFAELELDAAVLRHAALGDVQRRHDLEARDQRGAHLHRRLHDLEQGAVDAIAHAQLVLEAFEVDIRGAAFDGVGQNGVDELDDWGIVELHPLVVFVFLLDDFDVAFFRRDIVEQRLHRGIRRLVELLDRVAERELARDDRRDVVARDELEVINDPHVRRIGDGDGQRPAIALERQDEIFYGEIRRDQLGDLRIDLELGQVDRRHSVLAGEDLD